VDTARPALAVDVGGTKLAAGVTEPGGRLIAWEQTPTRRDLDAEQLWRTLDALITRVLEGAKVSAGAAELAGVGCGCGGPMEWPSGLVSPLNIPAWRAFPLRGRLAERFAGIPVRVHNDAICMTAGEHWRGAGRGTSNMLGMVVSTGAKDLAADGAAGHQVGVAAMRRAGKALGIAIASAMYLCDLEVVSVGGGLSQAGALVFDPLQEALRAHTGMEFTKQVRVVPAELGQGAGLVGAAALIFAADRYWSGDLPGRLTGATHPGS